MATPPNPEESIVEAALEMPAHERAAYLDKLCGNDPQLRQLVDALLHAHKKIISSQVVPPRDPPAASTQPDSAPGEGAPERQAPGGTTMAVSVTPLEKPGDHIGRYKLLEQIGEGGFGVVYVAEQREPVKRRVALKIVKLGMDTRQVVGRFEAERQALALMDHPNIAKVFDGGATEAGRPYFVMELVRGIKITDYCDQNNLPTIQRLELFIQICRAIQHAHQKGIIHRDIKPSNILVTLHDGAAVPKVIDFGIAKATQQELTEKTVYTQLHQFIGTPAYMSPEQAEMSGLDIDTRSDIYSLGVLLYELLTGKTPFDGKKLIEASLDEIRRVIREQEPPRPSTRISALTAEEQTTVAKRRQAELPKLVNQIRGDLDWIAMKCLEKDRSRRYETANGVATEIERFLKNEPVLARPPSNLYRFQKLARRNKLAFAAVAAVAVVLLLGVIVSSFEAARAMRAEKKAVQQQLRAEAEAGRADKNAEAERAERLRAEQAAVRASEALSAALVTEGQRLIREDASGKALACFARAARLDPGNRIATARIVSLLNQRSFPLPLTERPQSLDVVKAFAYSSAYLERPPDQKRGFDLRGHAIIDAASGKEISRVDFEGEPARTPTFSLDGEKMAILTVSNILVFHTRTGERVMAIPARYTGWLAFSQFTPDGRYLIIAGSGSGGVDVWDLVAKAQIFQRFPHKAIVWALATSEDGRRLATGIRTGEARLWDLRRGESADEPCPGAVDFLELACDPPGNYLITRHRAAFGVGKRELTEGFWDIRPGREVPLTLRHSASLRHAGYNPSGSMIETVGVDGTVRLWQADTGMQLQEPEIVGEKIEFSGFSSDSSLLALGSTSGTIGVWGIQNNRLLWSTNIHSDRVSRILFTKHGTEVISGGGERDGNVNIFNVRSGTLLFQITNRLGPIMSLALAPDNQRLAVAYRTCAEIWDLDRQQRVGERLTSTNAYFLDVAFSHDGRWLATSLGANSTQLWDALNVVNKPLQAFPHVGGVHVACFSSDDRLVLTLAGDHTARVWNRESGKALTEPLLHQENTIHHGGFGPGDLEVLSAGLLTAVVWDVRTGQAVCDPFAKEGGLVSAEFRPDGGQILTAGPDGTVQLHPWHVIQEPPPEWLTRLAEAMGGYHLNEEGVVEFLENAGEEIVRLRSTLAGAPETPLVRWGRWYLADRSTRTVNANSTLTVPEYAAQLCSQDTLSPLEEALDLNPTNGLAYLKLAALIQKARPETAALYRRLAANLGERPRTPSFADGKTTSADLGRTDAPQPSGDITNELADPRNLQALRARLGQVITVKGQPVVFGTSRSGTFHYLNFAKNYPSALTLAFHVSENPGEFRPEVLRRFLNNTVIVTGTVSEHQGVLQILMTSLSQIRVVDVSETPGSSP